MSQGGVLFAQFFAQSTQLWYWRRGENAAWYSGNSELKPWCANEQILPNSPALRRLTEWIADNVVMRIFGQQEVKVGGWLPVSQVWWQTSCLSRSEGYLQGCHDSCPWSWLQLLCERSKPVGRQTGRLVSSLVDLIQSYTFGVQYPLSSSAYWAEAESHYKRKYHASHMQNWQVNEWMGEGNEEGWGRDGQKNMAE